MRLPFFNSQKKMQRLYLELFLKEEGATALILTLKNDRLAVLDKISFTYSNGWENLTEDVDEALFTLESKNKVHVQECIFFVYSHFIDEKTTQIKKAYLAKIRELVKNIELKPLGYIECYEAVVKYLNEKEGLPLTAILVEFDKSSLSLFLYKGGRLIYKKTLQRSTNLISDLSACFADIKGKQLLPARIIIYNSEDLNQESSEILSHQWSEELFIQLPKVEIIREEHIINGLLRVFEEQLSESSEVRNAQTLVTPKEVLGFVIDEDIAEQKTHPPPPSRSAEVATEKVGFKERFLGLITSSSEKIRSLRSRLSEKKLPSYALFIGIGLIIISLLFVNELFFHRITLKIFLPTQAIHKSLIVVGAQSGADIMIQSATKAADLSQSKDTTGKQPIGEKAKGVVLVNNLNDSDKFIKQGTTLSFETSNYYLDSDLTVPAASIDAQTNATKPGTVVGNITATNIGPEFNLEGGKRFRIDDLSSTTFYAINDNAITGGTKKVVQTVAKQDIENLKTAIEATAKDQNQNAAIGLSPDWKTVASLTGIDLTHLRLSKEVGEEADKVSLSASVVFTYFSYREKDMIDFLTASLAHEVEPGYQINNSLTHYQIKSAEKKDAHITLAVDVDTKAVKTIANKDLINNVVAKDKNTADRILKDKYSLFDYQLVVTDPIPLFSHWLPFFSKNFVIVQLTK